MNLLLFIFYIFCIIGVGLAVVFILSVTVPNLKKTPLYLIASLSFSVVTLIINILNIAIQLNY